MHVYSGQNLYFRGQTWMVPIIWHVGDAEFGWYGTKYPTAPGHEWYSCTA
jgi:hypothetical protein